VRGWGWQPLAGWGRGGRLWRHAYRAHERRSGSLGGGGGGKGAAFYVQPGVPGRAQPAGGGYSTEGAQRSVERRPPVKVESRERGLMAREGGEQPKMALVLLVSRAPPAPEPRICWISVRMPLGPGGGAPEHSVPGRQARMFASSLLGMKPFISGLMGPGAPYSRSERGLSGRGLPPAAEAPRERIVSVRLLRGIFSAPSMRGAMAVDVVLLTPCCVDALRAAALFLCVCLVWSFRSFVGRGEERGRGASKRRMWRGMVGRACWAGAPLAWILMGEKATAALQVQLFILVPRGAADLFRETLETAPHCSPGGVVQCSGGPAFPLTAQSIRPAFDPLDSRPYNVSDLWESSCLLCGRSA